jgi:hypothetical protein
MRAPKIPNNVLGTLFTKRVPSRVPNNLTSYGEFKEVGRI